MTDKKESFKNSRGWGKASSWSFRSSIGKLVLRPLSDFYRSYSVSTCCKFCAFRELSSKIFDLPPRKGCALQGRAHRGTGPTLLQEQITQQCLTLHLHRSHLFLTLPRGAVYTSLRKTKWLRDTTWRSMRSYVLVAATLVITISVLRRDRESKFDRDKQTRELSRITETRDAARWIKR